MGCGAADDVSGGPVVSGRALEGDTDEDEEDEALEVVRVAVVVVAVAVVIDDTVWAPWF